MDNNVVLDPLSLENLKHFLSVVLGQDNGLRIMQCMQYAMLKYRLFERRGQREDLDEAIAKLRYAVAETREHHEGYATMLEFFGVMLDIRYERIGAIEDIEEAIRIAHQVVEITPDDHSDFAGRLSRLAYKLEHRYKRKGVMENLEKAIRITRQIIDIKSDNHHPDLAGTLIELGIKLSRRYDRIGAMEDLEEAIQIVHQAIEMTPDDHPRLAQMIQNQISSLARRYLRKGMMEDLEEAIRIGYQSIEIMPPDHPDLAGTLNNMGNVLEMRYTRTRTMKDLDEAIRIAHRAIEVTPDDHPDLAGRFNNLGAKFNIRYNRTKTMEDFDEAIHMTRQAIEVTPDDHPDLAGRLMNLGKMLESRYERTRTMKDLEETIQLNEQAWKCKNAAPFVRVRAAIEALWLLQSQQRFESAYSLSVDAVNLLYYIHNRSLDHQDQQYIISHFSGLAPTACSLALQIGKDPETALEVLEQGRGVILGLLMNDRSNHFELKAIYPELHARYQSLLLEVNKPVENIINDETKKIASKNRVETFAKLEQCVQDIQSLPGFGHFHKGLTAKQMQNCSTAGSIVIVNIADLRSDAVIITANRFKVLPLLGLSAGQAEDWIDQDLTTTSLNDRGRKNKVYLQFLSWLWYECVKLILDELQCHMQSSADDLPRIWWMGTGLASTFPFHSAGDISAGLSESVCYRAISSYTPTIKALQYSQGRVSTTTSILSDRDPWRVVIVTMPETPHANPLPATRLEEAEVKAVMGPFVSIKTLEHPDVDSTMAQLQECNVAHFACHGVSDPLDPSRSGLILQTTKNAVEEPQQAILSVQKLFQAHLSRAEIAYLSACSTAQNQAVKLSDEVLHVVSGFQIAGFRHVVGCLWPSDDKVCVKVAKSFYSELDERRTAKSTVDRCVALALHKAIMKVRESQEYRKRPLLWAQYVHFGA